MESVAFVNNNINELLEIGLSKIPESCRVSRSVRLVMDCFEKGMDWKDARNAIVEDSKDLGWFQAPANVAFVVLGLFYGGCDFKKEHALCRKLRRRHRLHRGDRRLDFGYNVRK